MSYLKQQWVNNQSPVSAERMNHIEDGIEGAESYTDERMANIEKNISYCSVQPLQKINYLAGSKKNDKIQFFLKAKVKNMVSVLGAQNVSTYFEKSSAGWACIFKEDGGFTDSLSGTTYKQPNIKAGHTYAMVLQLSDLSGITGSFQSYLSGKNSAASNAIQSVIASTNAYVNTTSKYYMIKGTGQVSVDGVFSQIWCSVPKLTGNVVGCCVIDLTELGIEDYTYEALDQLVNQHIGDLFAGESIEYHTKLNLKTINYNLLNLAALTFTNTDKATITYDSEHDTMKILFTADIASGGSGTNFGSNRVLLSDFGLKAGQHYVASFLLSKSSNSLTPSFALVFLNSSLQQVGTHRLSTNYLGSTQCRVVPEGAMYIQFAFGGTTNPTTAGNYVVFSDVQVVSGTQPKPYVRHTETITENFFDSDNTEGSYVTITSEWENEIVSLIPVEGYLDVDRPTSVTDYTKSLAYFYSNEEIIKNADEINNLQTALICKDSPFKSIAHRGLSFIAPENTMPSFKLAKQRGFAYVETDVRMTSDGVPVLCHDASISRVSDGGNQLVNNLTYQQLLQYDFGSWFSSEYAGTKIASLEDLMSFARLTGLKVLLELKDTSNIPAVMNVVNKYSMLENIEWVCTTIDLVVNLHNNYNVKNFVFESGESAPSQVAYEYLTTIKNEGCLVVISINYLYLTTEMINTWVGDGFKVSTWTVDEITSIVSMDKRITYVTSNALCAAKVLYEKAFE